MESLPPVSQVESIQTSYYVILPGFPFAHLLWEKPFDEPLRVDALGWLGVKQRTPKNS